MSDFVQQMTGDLPDCEDSGALGQVRGPGVHPENVFKSRWEVRGGDWVDLFRDFFVSGPFRGF
jgi:hypothetical protein